MLQNRHPLCSKPTKSTDNYIRGNIRALIRASRRTTNTSSRLSWFSRHHLSASMVTIETDEKIVQEGAAFLPTSFFFFISFFSIRFLYMVKSRPLPFPTTTIKSDFPIMLHYLRALPTLPKPYRSSRPSILALPLSDDMHACTTAPVVSFTEEPLINNGETTNNTAEHAMTTMVSRIVVNGSSLIHPTPTALSIPRPITMDAMDINAGINGGESSSYPEDLCPPDNFNMVSTWIYRSSFPKKKNFSFLKKLGLKSIL